MTWKPTRGITLSLVVALVVLGLAIYGATVSPAEAPPRAPQPSLSATRFFVLLPDGRVERSGAAPARTTSAWPAWPTYNLASLACRAT